MKASSDVRADWRKSQQEKISSVKNDAKKHIHDALPDVLKNKKIAKQEISKKEMARYKAQIKVANKMLGYLDKCEKMSSDKLIKYSVRRLEGLKNKYAGELQAFSYQIDQQIQKLNNIKTGTDNEKMACAQESYELYKSVYVNKVVAIKKNVTPGKPLPYIPDKVDIDHLNENGMLLTEKQRKQVKAQFAQDPDLTRVKVPLKHASGNSSFKEATVIRFQHPDTGEFRHFAVYQGVKHKKHAGKGGFGKVKFMQDLKTGEWMALKVLETKGGDQEFKIAGAKIETDNLVRVGDAAGGYERREVNAKGENKEQYLIAMKLAKGVDAEKMFVENRDESISASQVANVAKGMINEVKNLHNMGLIHRDIKPEQFLVDKRNQTVKLIDLGSAVDINNAKASTGEGVTLKYITPEIIKLHSFNARDKALELTVAEFKAKGRTEDVQTLRADPAFKAAYDKQVKIQVKEDRIRNESYQFTVKDDIYALGLSLGKVFGLAKKVDPNIEFKNVLNGDTSKLNEVYCIMTLSEAVKSNCIVKDPKERDALLSFLQRMTATDPNIRPAMPEIVKYFDQLEKKLTVKPNAHRHVLLDLNHYASLDADEKARLITGLKSVTQVWFVENDMLSTKEKLTVMRELKNAGIDVGERYFDLNKTPIMQVEQNLIESLGVKKEAIYLLDASHPTLSIAMPSLPKVPQAAMPPLLKTPQPVSHAQQSLNNFANQLKNERNRVAPPANIEKKKPMETAVPVISSHRTPNKSH